MCYYIFRNAENSAYEQPNDKEKQMPQGPYAAVAVKNGHIFCGVDNPFFFMCIQLGNRYDDVSARAKYYLVDSEDFAPSFMSGKKVPVDPVKDCLVRRYQRNRYRDFSVNDCPRKIHAKKAKRRNRIIREQEKKRICVQ
jgi:hypothetical protein